MISTSLRRGRLYAALLTSLLLPLPLLHAQGTLPGDADVDYEESERTVQPASPEPITLNLGHALAPPGGMLEGVVNPAVSDGALDLYLEGGTLGGLQRGIMRMDGYDPASDGLRTLGEAEERGMRTLLTIVGTPWDLATEWDGPELGDLPPWARSVPLDMQEWADRVADALRELRDDYGLVPDYVEIWNEPDRYEWWTGTRDEYLELYSVTSRTLDLVFPSRGFKIGGPGLASIRSTVGGSESLVLSLIDTAGAMALPLDFVSWHHYDVGGAVRYYEEYPLVEAALHRNGFHDTEQILSEWNVYPSNQGNPYAQELDGSHPAALALNILHTVAQGQLDGHCFFLLQDKENQFGTSDFLIGANGMVTLHGIHKPVWQVFQFLRSLAGTPQAEVKYPDNEYGLGVLAFYDAPARKGTVLVGWDTIESEWIWAEACRERGIGAQRVWDAVEALLAAEMEVNAENLELAGLTPYEAEAGAEVYALAVEAEWLEENPRSVELHMPGVSSLSIDRVWRFDAENNNPAARRDEFLPLLEWAEAEAQEISYGDLQAFLAGEGVDMPDYEDLGEGEFPDSAEGLAAWLGIDLDLAEEAWFLWENSLWTARIARADELNALPAATLVATDSVGAGVGWGGQTLFFSMEPDSVIVIEYTVGS